MKRLPFLNGRLREEVSLFLGFGVVGATGFIVDAVLLQIGLALGLGHVVARLISLIVALQVTFLANGLMVFRRLTLARLPRQWVLYMLSNGFGGLCNYGIYLAVVALGVPYVSTPLGALIIASAAALVINFAGSRLLVFRRGPTA